MSPLPYPDQFTGTASVVVLLITSTRINAPLLRLLLEPYGQPS